MVFDKIYNEYFGQFFQVYSVSYKFIDEVSLRF
jgi:hypothetical protein